MWISSKIWSLGFMLLIALLQPSTQLNNSRDGEDVDQGHGFNASQPAYAGSQSPLNNGHGLNASQPSQPELIAASQSGSDASQFDDLLAYEGWRQPAQPVPAGVNAQLSPGLRPGTLRFHVNDGYFFHRQRASGGRIFLRCVRSRAYPQCAARASVNNDLSGFISLGGHNHAPDMYHERIQQLRNNLLEACRARPNARVDVIYHEVCRNVQREVSNRVSLLSMRPSMIRAQALNRPNIPHSFDELHALLQNQELSHTLDGAEELYRGMAGVEGHRSLVFMSSRVVDGFGPVRHLFGDATFYSRPNNPASSQLYTFVSMRDNHVVPLLHSLMESRSEQAYRDLFSFFRREAPNVDPDFLVTDFEAAQQTALRNVFPLTRLTGCLWHYARAICRQVRSLDLHALVRDVENARRIVRLCYAIPLVPAARIQEALNCVVVEARRLNLLNQFQDFFHYIRQTWVLGVGVDTLSVFGVRFRTNNMAECHHRNLNSRLVRRPNVWRFLDLLRESEDTAWRDLGRIEQGMAPSRARRVTSVLNDARVRSCSRQIMNNEMDLLHFLSTVSWHLEASMRDMLMEREADDRPPSPVRAPAQQQPNRVLHPSNSAGNSVNNICPHDPDFQAAVFEQEHNGIVNRDRNFNNIDEVELFEDLMESDDNRPQARGRSRGRGRGQRSRGRGARQTRQSQRPRFSEPQEAQVRGQPYTVEPRYPVPQQSRVPPQFSELQQSRVSSTVSAPQQSRVPSTVSAPLRSRFPSRQLPQQPQLNFRDDFSDEEFLPDDLDENHRRWSECIICNNRVGRYAMLGCGAFPLCGFCLRQWYIRQGMRNCPHCGLRNPGWVRLDI